MSKQVLSIEQMQHLKELGVNIDNASFYCHSDKHVFTYSTYTDLMEYGFDTYPVFILQDILDLLPKTINKEDIFIGWYKKGGWCIDYFGISPTIRNEDLIEAAYEMLCWCVERGYTKTDK